MLPMMKEESSVGVDTLLQSKGVDMTRQEAREKMNILKERGESNV